MVVHLFSDSPVPVWPVSYLDFCLFVLFCHVLFVCEGFFFFFLRILVVKISKEEQRISNHKTYVAFKCQCLYLKFYLNPDMPPLFLIYAPAAQASTGGQDYRASKA